MLLLCKNYFIFVLNNLLVFAMTLVCKHKLSFNSSKSFCMVFKSRLYKLSSPSLYMSTEKLQYTSSTKYLGFAFGSDKKDDNDMLRHKTLRQLRILYKKSIRILRLF